MKAASSGTLVLPKWQYLMHNYCFIDGSSFPVYPVVQHSGWIVDLDLGDSSNTVDSITYEQYTKIIGRQLQLVPYGTALIPGAHILAYQNDIIVPDGTDLFTERAFTGSNLQKIVVHEEPISLYNILFGTEGYGEEYDNERILFRVDCCPCTEIPMFRGLAFFDEETPHSTTFVTSVTFESGNVYEVASFDASVFLNASALVGTTDLVIDSDNLLQDAIYNLTFTLEAKYNVDGEDPVPATLGTLTLVNDHEPVFEPDSDLEQLEDFDWDIAFTEGENYLISLSHPNVLISDIVIKIALQ